MKNLQKYIKVDRLWRNKFIISRKKEIMNFDCEDINSIISECKELGVLA